MTNATENQGLNQKIDQDKQENPSSSREKTAVKNIVVILAAVIGMVLLYFLSRYNYLLFHSTVEIFSIVIAFTIFAIAWNSRRIMDNNYLSFIGIAFLFIAGMDFLHTLAYNGMGVFPTFIGSNLATQLWIATRYLLSFSLLIPLLFVRRKIRSSIIFVGYSLVFAIFVISIFYLKIFPQAYIDNVGLTSFKVASEYAISLILIVAIGLLLRKKKEFSDGVFKLLLAGMVTAIVTELAFTLYADVYGITNMVGHLVNVVSFYLIYRALVETSLTKPYELLFRNLKQSESTLANRATELTSVNDRLEEEIAERKKAEVALKESEQLYHTVFDNSQDGFQLIELIYDADGKPIDHKFLRVNHAYEEIIGVKAENIINKTARYISPNVEPTFLEVPDRVIKTGKSEHVELYNKDINKHLDCYYFSYSKNVVGTLFRDITQRKNMEKQLQDSARLAAIGATAGMVGHDIRNPLQAMTSDVYLAKSDLESIPDGPVKDDIGESLDSIEKNLEYVNKIVQDLQDFARPLKPTAKETDIELVFNDVLVKKAIPKNIEISRKVETGAKKLIVDPDLLKRILVNLVNNAVQAMPKGGKLTVQAHKKANDVIITVKDTGVGIPEAVKGKLFSPLFTTKSKGQGFGLVTVKRMTESLGGMVTFESQENKGTTFTVSLPTPQK